ncbi:MAG: ferredoxin [Streptosporangiaceae bacterium]|jgi:ferredoxin|nr:ferredoxin [Streptosporangiaceae bacterium]MDX6434585.1 ferredoxin [Streptosporangiaceae bacterium]
MEMKIDRITCDGAGICAELLPELISRDEWGYPIIRDPVVTQALSGHAREAAALCPKLALRLLSSG